MVDMVKDFSIDTSVEEEKKSARQLAQDMRRRQQERLQSRFESGLNAENIRTDGGLEDRIDASIGEQNQKNLFGENAGVVSKQFNPETNKYEFVSSKREASVTFLTQTVNPDSAVANLRKQNDAFAGRPSKEDVFINKLNMDKIVDAGRLFQTAEDVGWTKAKRRKDKAELELFERNKNLEKGYIAADETDAGRTLRKRRRGQTTAMILSPEEVGDAMDTVNNIINNPKTAAPLSESEFESIKSSLVGTPEGREFLRKRDNAEIKFGEELDAAEATWQNSDDVNKFLEQYATDPYIGNYAAQEINEVMKDRTLVYRLEKGDSELAADARLTKQLDAREAEKQQESLAKQRLTTREHLANIGIFSAELARDGQLGSYAPEELKRIQEGLLKGDPRSLLLYDQWKRITDQDYSQVEGNAVKTVNLNSVQRQERRANNMTKQSLIGGADPTSPDARKYIEENGSANARKAIEVREARLTDKYKPDDDEPILATIPGDVSYELIALKAFNISIEDDISIEEALDQVLRIDPTVPTDNDALKIIKFESAKALDAVAEGAFEEMREQLEQITVEEGTNAKNVTQNWLDTFTAKELYNTPSFDADMKRFNGDISKYILSKLNVSGDERDYISMGLASSAGADGIAHPNAKNYGAIKDAYDAVNEQYQKWLERDREASLVLDAEIASEIELAVRQNPNAEEFIDPKQVFKVTVGDKEMFIHGESNKEWIEKYNALSDDDYLKRDLKQKRVLEKSKVGNIYGVNDLPEINMDIPEIVNMTELDSDTKNQVLRRYRETPSEHIKSALNDDDHDFVTHMFELDKKSTGKDTLRKNTAANNVLNSLNLVSTIKWEKKIDGQTQKQFLIDSLDALASEKSPSTGRKMNDNVKDAIEAYIGDPIVGEMLLSNDAVLRRKGVSMALALWVDGQNVQLNISRQMLRSGVADIARKYSGLGNVVPPLDSDGKEISVTAQLERAVDNLDSLPKDLSIAYKDEMIHELSLLRGEVFEMSKSATENLVDFTESEEDIKKQISLNELDAIIKQQSPAEEIGPWPFVNFDELKSMMNPENRVINPNITPLT